MAARYWKAIRYAAVLMIAHGAVAQTPSLSLSRGSGAPGANVTLTVSVNVNGGPPPSSVGWDFSYSSADLRPASGMYYATGPAANAAGKSAVCRLISAGDIRCIVAGINRAAFGNGIVATVTFQIASAPPDLSSPVKVTNLLSAGGDGNVVAMNGTSGSVVINQAPVPTSLICGVSSITAPASSTCAVTLNVAPVSNATVALSSSSGAASVPASVTVHAGTTTANFAVTASPFSSGAAAVIQATLNGASQRCSLTLRPAVPAVKLPGRQFVSPGKLLTFAVSASDPAGLPVSLSVSALPSGATFDSHTGNFRWTPQRSQSGLHVLQFTGTDTASASTTQSVVIMVTSATPGNPRPPDLNASIAQFASAGGWETSLTLVNLTTSPSPVSLSFFDESGDPLNLPLHFPQGAINPTTTPSLTSSIDPNGLLLLDTSGSVKQAAAVGWSRLTAGGVDGYATFTNTPNNWQAVVPLETRDASSYLLAFDNTGSLNTGLAIANLSTQPVDVIVIIRNDSGAPIGTETIALAAQGHTSFMLNSAYPITTGIRGTVEFDTSTGGQINLLGLRANGPALTTVPVLARVNAMGGSMAHVTYGGGWQTTVTLVNTGASSAQATLNFFGDNGNPLPMPLLFPQTGAASRSTAVTRTLAAGSSLIIETNGEDSSNSVSGSAQLTTTGNVSGFAIFRYNPSQQEAVVPLETRNASSYTLVFDNTSGVATGLALANESIQSTTLNLILRNDNGAEIGTGTVPLAAYGHSALVLSQAYGATAGIRGTVEIDAPAGIQFSALGVRFTPGQNITTIPVLVK
jgi:putative Ig domain-containing protein